MHMSDFSYKAKENDKDIWEIQSADEDLFINLDFGIELFNYGPATLPTNGQNKIMPTSIEF